MRRRIRIALALAAASCMLVACGSPAGDPPTEAESTVPAALEGADLGILEAAASFSLDGFTYNFRVTLRVDRDVISSDELREILQIIVNTTGEDADITHLGLSAADGTQPDTVDPEHLVDLQRPAQELGFAESVERGNAGVSIAWDEVADFVRE
ncbi:hypothetical protein [Microbacterium sp. Marseille-Q6965]|uniref:hypothetical protein n=1 Tax=Microbacterium sp. Marseille-Q6965 TaxID=2965072 RepID=UPI0021B7DB37|nr:hypothetical protein [Microbacterium sp. Marseille-Q6965]